jgi:hypothetical protein
LRNTEWACGVAVYTGIKDGTLTILVSTESQLPFCQVKELLTIMCSLAKMLRKLYVLHLLGSHFQVSLTLKLVVKKQWLIVSVRNVAGNETKLGMSKGLPEPKLTAADGMVDKLTGAIFAFQLVVVLILGVAGNTLQSYEADKVCGVLYNINAFSFLYDCLDSGCIVSLGSAWVGGGCVKVTTHQAGEG